MPSISVPTLLGVLSVSSTLASVAVAQTFEQDVQSAIDAAAAAGFTGQVCVHWREKAPVARAVGVADPQTGAPNSEQTLFYVGSVAKVMTSAVALQLCDEGVLAIDASIDVYLPDVPDDKKAITIRQLISHQSGLPANHEDVLAVLTREQFIDWALQAELQFAPGADWSYSNVGYSLLAAIIEEAAERPFEQQVRERVFDACAMESTFFLGELTHERASRLATGDGPLREQFGTTGRVQDLAHTWLRIGPGATVSTADDLARLGDAILQKRLHSDAGWAIATAPVRDGWATAFRASRTRSGTPLYFYDGGFPGFSAALALMPEEGGCVAMLSNHEGAAQQAGRTILGAAMAAHVRDSAE